MNPRHWQKVKSILEEAIELTPQARAAFLDKSCKGNTGLRQEVENLLEFESPEADLLEQTAVSTVLKSHSTIGKNIGNYRIINELGTGGMGAVFLAERIDGGFKQKVALKVVKKGMDSEAILRRFQIERQILANLNHPNIARLFDGGTTTKGLPFFAMEYVEGKPLDEYCDQYQLSISDRLEIFRQVCSAVAYAHEHSVIHRDLKPSNILVTNDGTPKLLDFGIAKILRSESSAQTTDFTETIFRAMTPRYASPEQIRGERLTASTDIYSLGVLLYELLTGCSPYKTKTHHSAEIVRFMSEQMPERPSTAITRSEEITPTDDGGSPTLTEEYICRTRGAKPDKLRRQLRGDLDNIVMMALSKEPNERYDSVKGFSADIKLHLEGLPVHARKSTAIYRSATFLKQKFARNWQMFLILLLLVTIVAGAASGFSVYLIKRWETPIATVSKVRSIAVLPFKYVGDSSSDDNPLLGVGLTDFLITKLGQTRKLEVRPIGAVQAYRGQNVSPQPIGESLGVDTILSGTIKQDNETVSITAELISIRDGKFVWKKVFDGKMKDLVSLQNNLSEELSQVLALSLTQNERDSFTIPRTNNIKAYELYVRGRYFWNMRNKDDYLKAIEYFNQAIALDPNYADAYAGLADAYALLACVVPFDGRAEKMQLAKDFAHRALSIDEKLAGPHATLGFIGWHYDWDWESSEREFKIALEMNPSYATAHQWYALLLERTGRFDEAQTEIKSALKLDPLSFAMQEDQAEILFVSRRYDEAIEAGYKIKELSPSNVFIYSIIHEAYYQKGDYQKYIEVLEKRVELENRSLPSLKLLADGYMRLNRKDDFQKILKELNNRGEHLDIARHKNFEEQKKALKAKALKGALDWLDYEFKNRGAGITAIHVRPEWDSLRNQPQIQEYIRQMKLLPYMTKGDEISESLTTVR